MKKYFLSFFILITLAGVVISIFSAQAQTPVSFLDIPPKSPEGDGTCARNTGQHTTMTYAQCMNALASGYIWIPIGGYAPASHLGFCKLINSIELNVSQDNKTLTQCTNLSKQTFIIDAVWEPHNISYGYLTTVIKAPPAKGSCVMLNESGEELKTNEVTSFRCTYLSNGPSIVSAKWMQNGKRSFTQIKTPSVADGASNINQNSSYKKEGTCTLTYRFGTPKQEVLETNYMDCLFKYEKGVCYVDPEADVDSQGEKIEGYTKRYEGKTADECRDYNWPGIQKTFWELVEYEFTPTPATNTPTGTESAKNGICYTKAGDETTLNKTQCTDKSSVGNYWISDDANAMANLGTCIRTSTSGQTLTTGGTTVSDCTSLSNDSSITSASWKQDGYNVYLAINTPNSTNAPSLRPDTNSLNNTNSASRPSSGQCVNELGINTGFSESECVSPNEWIGDTRPASTSSGNYVFLEPLPCKTGDVQCENGELAVFDTSGTGKLGEYLNIMITLFIGLCAVLAVIMIVIGGIEYSTSELVSSKAAAKDRIQSALLGLLLALMSWLLLNTINPDLLRTDFDVGDATLGVDYEDVEIIDGDTVVEYSGPIPSGPSGACTMGVERTRSGIVACKDVAQNLQAMIDAARAAGINLSGGGYRTYQQQIETRRRNCGTSDYAIYHMPANQCRPPTARPGRSMHESGRAFDFNCNGTLIRTRNNSCFAWLQANASRFGFYNLPSEPWHWSVNGR